MGRGVGMARESWRGKRQSEMTPAEREGYSKAMAQWQAENKRREIRKANPEAIAGAAAEARKLFRR